MAAAVTESLSTQHDCMSQEGMPKNEYQDLLVNQPILRACTLTPPVLTSYIDWIAHQVLQTCQPEVMASVLIVSICVIEPASEGDRE